MVGKETICTVKFHSRPLNCYRRGLPIEGRLDHGGKAYPLWTGKAPVKTRMHSSGMRTTHLCIVPGCWGREEVVGQWPLLPGGGGGPVQGGGGGPVQGGGDGTVQGGRWWYCPGGRWWYCPGGRWGCPGGAPPLWPCDLSHDASGVTPLVGQTDTCENMTFPQLRLRTVKNPFSTRRRNRE